MRILVTGAEGQLGRALRGVADGNEWLFTDLPQFDIADPKAVEALFERERPEAVVNCAAFTDVDRAETEREAAFRVNRDAPRFLAAASARAGAVLVHVSTDFVFDGAAERPYTEEDEPAPLNIYGESKLAGERSVRGSGCRGAVIRTSWLYSPWGKNFVKAILHAAADKSEIRVVADQRGCPTAADGLAGAIVRMLPALISGTDAAGGTPVYNYCDAGVVSRADFAAEIIRQAGLGCRIVPVSSSEYPSAARRPLYSALDTGKITRTFGITPPPWREALAECLNDIKDGR